MRRPHSRTGFDLYEIKSLPSVPAEDVYSGPNSPGSECRFIESGNGAVAKGFSSGSDRLGVFEVVFIDKPATWESLPGQFADGGAAVKERLPACGYRVHQIAVVALQGQVFEALESTDEPGLG